MHEMALAESVIQIVEETARRNAAAGVRAVWLEIGRLSHVEPEALRFAARPWRSRASATPARAAGATSSRSPPGTRCG
jgi:hydrogenase nickel incorporation protein HypA/HybF